MLVKQLGDFGANFGRENIFNLPASRGALIQIFTHFAHGCGHGLPLQFAGRWIQARSTRNIYDFHGGLRRWPCDSARSRKREVLNLNIDDCVGANSLANLTDWNRLIHGFILARDRDRITGGDRVRDQALFHENGGHFVANHGAKLGATQNIGSIIHKHHGLAVGQRVLGVNRWRTIDDV